MSAGAHVERSSRYVSPARARVEQLLPALLYQVFLLAVLTFITVPILVVVLSSLNSSQYLEFPPTGVSLRWWQAALTDRWLAPIAFSLRLAIVTALLATLIGTLAALGLVRGQFRGKEVISSLVLSPLLLPQIVTGVALLQYLTLIGARELLGFPALVLGHLVITVPYAVRTIMVSLVGFDQRLEWAAQDLGAGPLTTFRWITLPLIKNGVFAGFVFAFIVSFNDVPISLFMARPGEIPIPIAILNYMEFRFDPALSAVAVMTILIVLGLIAVGERFARVSEFVYRQD